MTTGDGQPQEPRDDGLGFAAMSRALGSALAGLPADQSAESLRPAAVPVAPAPLHAARPSPAALAVADRIIAAAGYAVAVVPRAVPNTETTSAIAQVPASASPLVPDLTVRRSRTPLALRTADGEVHAVASGVDLTIGRDGAVSDIVIDRPEISRNHVRIALQDGTITATDLGSTNGTALVRAGVTHGLSAHEAVALIVGDVLVVLDDIVLGEVVQASAVPGGRQAP